MAYIHSKQIFWYVQLKPKKYRLLLIPKATTPPVIFPAFYKVAYGNPSHFFVDEVFIHKL